MADLLTSNEIFFREFQPKVKNRFIVYVDGLPSFLVKKIDRPKWRGDRIALDHINIQRYVMGKVTWEEISMDLYDPITPSATQAVFEWFRLAHESVTGRAGYADFYKKDMTINEIGPVGDKISEWTLIGAFPTSFNGGDLDWSTQDPVIVSVTISYDYAILQY